MSDKMQCAPDKASTYGEIQYERNTTELIDEIKAIDEKLKEGPRQSDLWIEKGILLRKRQLLCREGVESQSMALTYDPFNPLLYRYRGHYCINIGRYAEGAADLELSLRLDPGNWDTWYHSGLAYYLLKDYERARKAYEGCLERTKPEDHEHLAAVLDWYWLTLMHLGEDELAAKALEVIDPSWEDVSENFQYFNRLLVYKGVLSADEVVKDAETRGNLDYATETYGISYWYELKGEKEKAKKILDEIERRSFDSWNCFAVRAAEVRLADWKDE